MTTKLKKKQLYAVKHSRKGKFNLLITEISGEWITGIIKKGTANALLDYNVKETGEEITIRECLCKFEKI